MKKVLILFGKSDWQKKSPFEKESHRLAYEYFYSLCKNNGIQMYRASYEWYDYKKNIFDWAWTYTSKNESWKKVRRVKPDLIYDKTPAKAEIYHKKELISKNYLFINDLEFTQTVRNKFIISLLFEKWSKKNWLVRNKRELGGVLPHITSSKVVLKPLNECGGKYIQILDKKEILKNVVLDRLYLVQEFIDSSHGIPGINKTLHDLRVILVNKKIIYSYIREPKEGNYLANLAQGGSLKILPLNKLPRSIFPIIESANQVFETFNPRIFAIDFLFDQDKKPWVVELNAMPGLYPAPGEQHHINRLYREMIRVFHITN